MMNIMALVTFGVRLLKSRLKNLEDVLLCLAAQTNLDFKIIIVSEFGVKKELENLINLYDITFQKKIKIIFEELNRSKRLQNIISNSESKFTVFLDDDDHIHDNYVQIISDIKDRAIIVTKSVSRVYEYPNSLSKTEEGYIRSEVVLAQFFYNTWPFGSIVFPTDTLKEIELNYNIEVLEDWDLVQKALLVNTNIIFLDEVTFIYNRRLNQNQDLEIFQNNRNRYFNKQVMLSRLKSYGEKNSLIKYNEEVFDLVSLLKSERDIFGALAHNYRVQSEILTQWKQELENQKLYKLLHIIRRIQSYFRRKNHD
jgi:hypothetical protein